MMRGVAVWLVGFLVVFAAAANARQDDVRLDELFSRLQQTADEQEARLIEGLIWTLWFDSGDPAIDRLMEAGSEAMNAGRYPEALGHFNRVIDRDPAFAEGWNRRATLYYLMGDFDASVRDIQETLTREPRHFGALSGLGLINTALERWDAAIKAYEEALRVDPHLAGAKQIVEDLKKKLKQDI